MEKRPQTFDTLGEKLNAEARRPAFRFWIIALVSGLIGLLFRILLKDPALSIGAGLGSAVLLLILVLRTRPPRPFLLRFDQQGFISGLKLSRKTAVFDGSNIYHFGLDRKLGRVPLGALVSALRSEGFRIICFFDANIYFTLRDNGALPKKNQRFSTQLLQRIFELEANEIFVVPKGVQADKFIIETLSHLPKSFAVTNDRFRDYESEYAFLAKDNQWRKGVKVVKGELQLYQHRFKHPLKLK